MALAGEMRYNPDTQMTEVYSGDRWIAIAQKLKDPARWEDVKKQFDTSKKQFDTSKKQFDTSFYDNFDRYRREFVEEKVKVKALDELFGVK